MKSIKCVYYAFESDVSNVYLFFLFFIVDCLFVWLSAWDFEVEYCLICQGRLEVDNSTQFVEYLLAKN